MVRNFLKVAFRNLWKHKFYTGINVLGLSVGIASVLLMVMYVQHELSYDRHYDTADRIYRVHFSGTMAGQDFDLAVLSPQAGPTFLEEYPEVEDYGRFRNTGTWNLEFDSAKFQEGKIVYADQGISRLFDFEYVVGDVDSALDKPRQLVITERAAKKYFGEQEALGQVLKRSNGEEWAVAAIIRDLPENVHFDFDVFASAISLDETTQSPWLSNNFQTYIQLYPEANPATVAEKFPGTIAKYMGQELEQFLGKTLETWESEGNQAQFYMIPLTDIHLHSQADAEIGANGDIRYVIIFGLAALFILIIACINFMNLATARSANRAKEVGIRKTLGSVKAQLIGQFLSEAFVLSFIAFFIGIALALLCLEAFSGWVDKTLTLNTLDWTTAIPTLLGIAILIGLLAGSYPAFYLSAFNPTAVLKGKIASGLKHKWLRSSLVVVQFATSILLIICTLVVSKQMRHIQNQNLGYDKEHLVSVTNAFLLGNQLETYKEEVLRDPAIVSGTIASSLPVPSSSNNTLFFPGSNPDDPRGTPMQIFTVDFDYLETLGIGIKYGRAFDEKLATDSGAVLLNEAAMRQFEWNDSTVLGQSVGTFVNQNLELGTYEVIGVMEDFIFENMREVVKPMVMVIGPSRGRITFRVAPEEMPAALTLLESQWDVLANGQPFDYEFVDESFNSMYEADQRRGKLFTASAGLAILIACLGLFGLAAFSAEQRRKEIGVRKVLGASVSGLLVLLSKEFMVLIGVAFVIASAAAGYLMDAWLQDFTFRTTLDWWVFVLAGGLALMVAWLTMGFQGLRAARANPVKSLRAE